MSSTSPSPLGRSLLRAWSSGEPVAHLLNDIDADLHGLERQISECEADARAPLILQRFELGLIARIARLEAAPDTLCGELVRLGLWTPTDVFDAVAREDALAMSRPLISSALWNLSGALTSLLKNSIPPLARLLPLLDAVDRGAGRAYLVERLVLEGRLTEAREVLERIHWPAFLVQGVEALLPHLDAAQRASLLNLAWARTRSWRLPLVYQVDLLVEICRWTVDRAQLEQRVEEVKAIVAALSPADLETTCEWIHPACACACAELLVGQVDAGVARVRAIEDIDERARALFILAGELSDIDPDRVDAIGLEALALYTTHARPLEDLDWSAAALSPTLAEACLEHLDSSRLEGSALDEAYVIGAGQLAPHLGEDRAHALVARCADRILSRATLDLGAVEELLETAEANGLEALISDEALGRIIDHARDDPSAYTWRALALFTDRGPGTLDAVLHDIERRLEASDHYLVRDTLMEAIGIVKTRAGVDEARWGALLAQYTRWLGLRAARDEGELRALVQQRVVDRRLRWGRAMIDGLVNGLEVVIKEVGTASSSPDTPRNIRDDGWRELWHRRRLEDRDTLAWLVALASREGGPPMIGEIEVIARNLRGALHDQVSRR